MEILIAPRFPSVRDYEFIRRLESLGYEVHLGTEAPRTPADKHRPLYNIVKGGETVLCVQAESMVSLVDGELDYAPLLSFTKMLDIFCTNDFWDSARKGHHRAKRASWPEEKYIRKACGHMELMGGPVKGNGEVYNPAHGDVFAQDWIIYS